VKSPTRAERFLAARFSPHIDLSFYPAGFAVHRDDLLGRVAPEAAVALPRAIRIVSQGVPPVLREAEPFASQGRVNATRLARALKVLETMRPPVSRGRESCLALSRAKRRL
jgi:hypothetical protein